MLARVCVLVSGNGSNLQALIDEKSSFYAISLVVSSHSCAFALKRAKNAGIPAYVVKKSDQFEEKIKRLLFEFEIDLIVLAGFVYVLSSDFVSLFPKRMINVHPSLIPAFCGYGFYGDKVHQAVLDYGVKISGASVHYVSDVVDGGELIMQESLKIRKNETLNSLQKRVLRLEHKILPKALNGVAKTFLKERKCKKFVK